MRSMCKKNSVDNFFKKVEQRERTQKPNKEFHLCGLDMVEF